MRGFPEVVSVDIAHEPHGQATIGFIAQRLVRHRRTEVAPADPDVDNIGDPPAGRTLPFSAAYPRGEGPHPFEYGVNRCNDIGAIDQDLFCCRGPKGNVQRGAVLGGVDLLAGEHRIDPCPEPGPLRDGDE